MWVIKKQLFYKNVYDKNGKSIPVKDNNGNYVFTEESLVKITSFNTFCVNNYRIIEFLTTVYDEVFNVLINNVSYTLNTSNEGKGWVKCHNQDINSLIVRFNKANYEQTFNINYPLCH